MGGVCLALLWLFCSCTAARHHKAADKEVYRIIEGVESSVFGRTNAFTIDTPYSGRDPAQVLPPELIEDRLQSGRRVVAIAKALELAAQASRRYQTEKERLYLTALSLTGDRYEFSPQFFASSDAALARTGEPRFVASGTNIVKASSATVSGASRNQIGVSQLLKSGGRLGVTLVNDLFRYYTGNPERSVVSTLSVDVFQPLLRGFGRNNPAVESLKQAERDVIYAVRNFSFFQNDFAVEIVTDYFTLLAQKEVVRNRYTNYLGRAQLTRRMEARAQDREQLNAVDQARQAELTARNTYVNQVAGHQTSLDQFKIKLGLPVGERLVLDDSALLELHGTGLVPAALPIERGYRLATERQLQVLNAIDRFEDSKRKIRVAKNRLKADLNVFADATLESERPTDYTNFDPDEIRAGVGLELNFPLDRLRERNDYRATLVAFESELRNLTLRLDTLRDSVERGLRTLALRRQTYHIQLNAVALANRRVASTTLLLQAGRADVRDVSEAQDAQINAQNALTAAQVDYLGTRLQLMLDVGALDATEPKFWLKDQVMAFLGEAQPPAQEEDVSKKPVIPPDEFFNN